MLGRILGSFIDVRWGLSFKRVIHPNAFASHMGGERQVKRSCPFCQYDERDALEQGIIDGVSQARILDKDMGWRANTAERHMKNHAGDYHAGANHSCLVCTSDDRKVMEVAYFEGERTTDDISEELDCSEELVYRHMKHHFQPLVKQSSTALVAVKVGQEIEILRNNVEGLNGKLAQYMSETNIHDDGVVTDMVKLHKEVRETLKDLTSYQEKWAEPTANVANNTINVLKVELGKESPDVWKRVKTSLLKQADGELDVEILDLL
tara:strand:- start:163 stop:954 length:792 start_codon:yes stop_codon:yes gene_type:complete